MHDEDLGFFEPRPWHQDRPQRPKVWGDGTLSNWWGPMSHNPGRAPPSAVTGADEPAQRASAHVSALARRPAQTRKSRAAKMGPRRGQSKP
jgi:hypothetical protein